MKPRTACFCFLCVLWCWRPGYPETYQKYTASVELQRAREQAEIEHWRAVEAKARSLRNTPDTEVHRKGRPSLQRSWETEEMRGAAFYLRKPDPDLAASKKARSSNKKFHSRKYTGKSESQGKKRRQSRKEAVALK